MSDFGHALKHLRAELKLAQSELAGAVGSTQRHISFLETGRSRPSPEMVRRLATELNLNAGQRAALFEASGMKNPFKKRSFSSEEVRAALDMIERHVLSNWPFPAFVLDEDWNLLRTNPAAEAMLAGVDGRGRAQPVPTIPVRAVSRLGQQLGNGKCGRLFPVAGGRGAFNIPARRAGRSA